MSSKMTMAMDVHAMLATKNVTEIPISVKHLTPPPFAVTILRGIVVTNVYKRFLFFYKNAFLIFPMFVYVEQSS